MYKIEWKYETPLKRDFGEQLNAGYVSFSNPHAKITGHLAYFRVDKFSNRKTIDLFINYYPIRFQNDGIKGEVRCDPLAFYVEKLRIDINDKKSIETAIAKEMKRIQAFLIKMSSFVIEALDEKE